MKTTNSMPENPGNFNTRNFLLAALKYSVYLAVAQVLLMVLGRGMGRIVFLCGTFIIPFVTWRLIIFDLCRKSTLLTILVSTIMSPIMVVGLLFILSRLFPNFMGDFSFLGAVFVFWIQLISSVVIGIYVSIKNS